MSRQILGVHWPNHPHRKHEELVQFIGDSAPVTILHMQARDRYQWLRETGPNRLIHVRIYRQWWEEEDPKALARWAARELAYLWGDPLALVSPANEQNIELRAGPGWLGQQDDVERCALYARIGRWNIDFWDELDRLVPDRKALALWSALAAGHDAVRGIPDSEYQVPEIRAALDRVDVLATHPYGKLHHSPHTVPGGADQYWHMLRPWRSAGFDGPHDPGGLLAQYPGRPHFISETGTFVHDRESLSGPTARALEDLAVKAGADRVTLGITPFIWSSDPQHHQNIIEGNAGLVGRLLALPPHPTSASVPTAGGDAPPPDELVYRVQRGDTLSRIGKLYGIDWRRIADKNGIMSPWIIRVGQQLTIPGAMRERPAERLYDLQILDPVRNRHRSPDRRVRWIILHDPGVSNVRPSALLSALRNTTRSVSYHRVLSDEARPVVYELVPRGDVAWHAGSYTRIPRTDVYDSYVNVYTWSLSIMHPMPDSHWPALVQALADMIEEADLPDSGVILAHREVSTMWGRRSDPRDIDMDRLRRGVQAELDRRKK